MEISSMFPGFRFSPTDQELISHYLKRKIDGLEESGEVIAEVDICKFEPWDLPGKSVIPSDHEWFFFSPNGRKYPNGSQARRATEIGFWKATGKERSIKSGPNVIGTKRTLVFHIGRAPKGERTDWIMHEYCIKGNKVDKSQNSFVICRLRKKMDFTQTTDSQCRESASHDGSSPANVSLDAASQIGRDMLQDSNLSVVEDDCFADILKDDIIKLDDILLRPLQLPVVEEKSETENKLTQLTEPACMSQVHPTQGIANRRIGLQTQLSRWKGREMLGADGDGYVTKAIQGNDDKMVMKGWKSNKNIYGCMIVTILLIVVIVFVVSSQQLLSETLPIRF